MRATQALSNEIREKRELMERDFVLRFARSVFYFSCFMVPLTAVRAVVGFAVSDVALFIALGLSFLSMQRYRVHVPAVLWIGTSLAVLAVMMISLTSASPSTELGTGIRMGYVWFLLPLAALRLLANRRHSINAASAFVLGSALSGAVAVGQYAGFDARPLFFAETAALITDPSGLSSRFIGLNGQPNGQGGTLAIAATLCFAAINFGIRRRLAIISVILIVSGLFLAASITGIIATTLGLLVLLMRIRNFKMMAFVGVLAVAGPRLLEFIQSQFPTLVTPFDRVQSATGQTGISTVALRAETINHAMEHLAESPFIGRGFTLEAAGTYDGFTAAHNMEVLAWYQGGLLMLAGVVLVAVAALRWGWRRGQSPLIEALFAATCVALFFAQTGPSLFDRYVWLTPMLLLAQRRIEQEDKNLLNVSDPAPSEQN